MFVRIPVAEQSQVWACRRSLAGIANRQCCVLSGRGLCVELITRT